MPDFKPFGQDLDSPPLGLPEMDAPQEQAEYLPPMPQDYQTPGLPEEPPAFPDEEAMPQMPHEEELPHELPPLMSQKPAIPISRPIQRPEQKLPMVMVRHANGAVFMRAENVAELAKDAFSAAERLKRMGVRIAHIEEQEKATEQWKEQLEGLYRRLIYAERTIFTGD